MSSEPENRKTPSGNGAPGREENRLETARPAQPPASPATHQRLHPPVRKIAIWGPMLAVCLVAGAAILGAWHHIQQQREQEEFKEKTSAVTVNAVTVHRDTAAHEMLLPGEIQAFTNATLYARTNGYLAKWYVDIGADVKEGQLLAEIETPEVDRELDQARGALKQAESNLEIARVTAERWSNLVQKKVVAPQDNDEKQAAFQAAKANLVSAQANVARLEQLQAFKRITAPFDGKITLRRVDVGSLVSAGAGSAGTALFGMAKTDPLRIYVNVPQTDVPAIHEGNEAQLVVREYTGQTFSGRISHVSGALDPQSRTLLTEIEIPNPEGKLYPGMYAQVKFILKDENGPIIVPANAFFFGVQGAQVAVVTKDNRIHWQSIQVGRDFGTAIQVSQGLDENSRVVMNPTDDLVEGLQVNVQPEPVPTSGSGNDRAKQQPAPAGSPAARQ